MLVLNIFQCPGHAGAQGLFPNAKLRHIALRAVAETDYSFSVTLEQAQNLYRR